MGKEDKKLKNYFEDPGRFADVWNAIVYKGQQVVRAEELYEVNSVFTAVTGDAEEERIADMVMKRTRGGNDLGILILENQDRTDYSMPVRIFHEEALAYLKQVREIEARNRVTVEQLKKMGRLGVYYYYFTKDDKVRPVSTLVLCWDEKGWKGGKSLWDVMDFTGVEEMRETVPEYPIRVIDMAHIENEEAFQTDLGTLVGLIRRKNDKDAFRSFAIRKGMGLGRTGWAVLGELLHSKRIMNLVTLKDKDEKEDEEMSVVGDWIDQMYDDGFNKGIEQGTKREGYEKNYVHVTMLMKNMNWTEEKACQALSIPMEDYRAAQAAMKNGSRVNQN